MIEVQLGEREGFAPVAGIGLAPGVVPAFPVRGRPTGLVHASMGQGGKDVAIGVPEVTETATPLIGGGNPLPQLPTGLLTAVPNHKGDNLPGAPTQGRPQPALVLPRAHKTPPFIHLQVIARSRGDQRVLDCLPLGRFFLTTPPAFAAPRQRPAQSLACWVARSTRLEAGLSRPQYRGHWDLTRRSSHTPYPDTVAALWDYARSSRWLRSANGGIDG